MKRSGTPQGSSRKSHISAIVMMFLITLALVSCSAPGMLTPSGGGTGKSGVTLSWDANQEQDLAGYKVYYGTRSGSYDASLDVGGQTSCRINGLQAGETYYIVITAYNTSGAESGYSTEITCTPG